MMLYLVLLLMMGFVVLLEFHSKSHCCYLWFSVGLVETVVLVPVDSLLISVGLAFFSNRIILFCKKMMRKRIRTAANRWKKRGGKENILF
jgi:hypothetical protein